MRRAVLALTPLPDAVLVDVFRIPDLHIAQRGVLHGDRRCAAIAAASIIAKVSRDRQMLTDTRATRATGTTSTRVMPPPNIAPPSNGSGTRPCTAAPSSRIPACSIRSNKCRSIETKHSVGTESATLMRLLLTAFFLGKLRLYLLLAPWSEFWDRNYFAQGLPLVHALMINNFVRGAVSGLGLVNMGAAVAEMHAFFAERRVEHVISLPTLAAEE